MKENTQEKSLIKDNGNRISYKIKMFFRNIFNKKDVYDKKYINDKNTSDTINIVEPKNSFAQALKNDVDNEEFKILELQKQYEMGIIKDEDLTATQINELCKLYDKQIEKLKRTNEIRKQKILEYRMKMK